jgi:signal transduction histidine kinase
VPRQRRRRPRADRTLELAHALRNPLTSLALGLGLLEEGALGPLDPVQREVVSALVADVAKLSLLVDRTLKIERLGAYAGPVDRRPACLDELVERAAAPLLPQAEARGVAIARALAPGIRAVVDPVKVTWVVASLLGNALRYSPEGGTVRVELAARGGEAELRIVDQGPGMPPDVQARLFERSGGLGLFLAREIVEAHGGTIRVSSEVGCGSVFTVTLPLEGGLPRGHHEQEG